MLRRTCTLASIAFSVSMFVATEPLAVVLPQRTFVASFGNDGNPCSLTLPCRGFAAAVAQTISGGEVIVLDSAGYGPVTIAQSVSIIAPPGVYAGISVPASGTGVAIIGAGINVVLRGLTINSTGGSYGIRMTNGAALTVENCEIANFVGGATGVSIETAAAVSIAVSTIRDNFFGIIIGFGATASITKTQVLRIIAEGIEIYGGSSGTTNVFVTDTLVTGDGQVGNAYCVDNFASAGTTGNIYAIRVTVSNCAYGFANEPGVGASGTTTFSYSMVTGNFRGLYNFSGTFESLANSNVSGNNIDIAGAISTISAH